MNRSKLRKRLPEGLVWCGVVALSVAVALAQDSAPQNQAAGNANQTATSASVRTDGQIEMDVVHALDASQALKDDLITAATIQSEVTLAGTVSTDASKKLAESIASKVPGVTNVHNNLIVGNPQQAQDAMESQPADESDPGQSNAGQPQQANGQSENGPMPPPQAYPQQAPQQYPDQGQYPAPQGQYPPQRQYPPAYPQPRPQYAPYGSQQRGITSLRRRPTRLPLGR
jgi:hypothetical protein